MARELGYVSPLLSNLAVDHSKKVREGLIAPLLFPRVTVGKPSGKFAVYSAENAYKVPDVTMAGERSRAAEFSTSGKMKEYAASRYGLKSFIDKADLEFMDGPFRLWERQKTEMLVGKLELAQEKRVADTVLALAGRSTALAGTGTAKGNKWGGASASAGGDPHEAIRDAVGKLFYRPNLMILSESVFDVLEFHPRLLDKLGEANMIKKVDEAALAKLFRINRVVISKGRADFGKRAADEGLTVSSIWGSSVVLAYVSSVWDEPCAGKTLAVKYQEADGQGYVVRTWDEEDGGLLGGEYVQVGHDAAELVVAENLIYSLKDVV
jgi:energy-coupling factor transporter ATP-binding protein EcfA2